MLRMLLFRMRMTPIIASIAAHTQAIAIMAFMKLSLPRRPTGAVRAFGLAGQMPAGTTVL
jgi:hypothetical protein